MGKLLVRRVCRRHGFGGICWGGTDTLHDHVLDMHGCDRSIAAVALDTRDGLYDMTFFTTGKGPQSHDGIHPEMLQEVFGANTGLYRALRASA